MDKTHAQLDVEKMYALVDFLPHGSGINGDWSVERKGAKIIASNTYSAMNDCGMYCHDYPFTVTYTDIQEGYRFDSINVEDDENCECGFDLENYLSGEMPF
jgi:uncharacterized protein YkuJ